MNAKVVRFSIFLIVALSQAYVLVTGQSIIGGGNVTFEEVRALEGNTSVLLIDVRQPSELAETGVIPGSINIPLDILEDVLTNLSPADFYAKYQREKPNFDTIIVFTCRTGGRSAQAQRIAVDLGFVNAKNYPGGWVEWEVKIKE